MKVVGGVAGGAGTAARIRRLDESAEEYEESYDKLVLATGANAIVPRIPGIENARLFTVKTVTDIACICESLEKDGIKRVTVVGGGFIGVEVAVNLKEAGCEISLVEVMPQILGTYDYDMVQILQKEMLDQGVNLVVGDKAVSFDGSNMTLESGKVVEGDAIIMAVGVRPDAGLVRDCGLELNERGQ